MANSEKSDDPAVIDFHDRDSLIAKPKAAWLDIPIRLGTTLNLQDHLIFPSWPSMVKTEGNSKVKCKRSDTLDDINICISLTNMLATVWGILAYELLSGIGPACLRTDLSQ